MRFKREDRYIILKKSDMAAALEAEDMDRLESIVSKVAAHRESAGKIPLQCVVVESDWPEYEEVWGLIKSRAQCPTIEELQQKIAGYEKQFIPKYGHPNDWPYSYRVDHLKMIEQVKRLRDQQKAINETEETLAEINDLQRLREVLKTGARLRSTDPAQEAFPEIMREFDEALQACISIYAYWHLS